MKYLIKEIKDSSGWYDNYEIQMKNDEEPIILFHGVIISHYIPANLSYWPGDPPDEKEEVVDVSMYWSELQSLLEAYCTEEELDKVYKMYDELPYDKDFIKLLIDKYLEKALDDYWSKHKINYLEKYYYKDDYDY